MSIVLLIMVIIIFNGAQFATTSIPHEDYLSKKQTTIINGVFVIMVILSHARQYMTLAGPYHDTYIFINNFLNQAIVVTFSFYSVMALWKVSKKEGHLMLKPFLLKY